MWKSVNFKVPAAAAAINQGADPVLAAVAGEMSAAGSRLSGVAGFIPVTPSIISGSAGNAQGLISQLNELLNVSSKFLCAHPYVHPLGDKRGDYTYLSPSGCLDGMLAKLADPSDDLPETVSGSVFLKFTAYDHADLAAKLAAFNAVLPVTPLQMVQRRAEDLNVLETEKYILGDGFISPKFQDLDARQQVTNNKMDSKLARMVAVSHGYDCQNKRPETLLSELITKKQKATEEAGAAWERFCSLFSGGSGQAAYLNGSVRDIRLELANMGTSDGTHVLSVICCWIGEAEAMTVFREVLGI
ncbi:hypothetical protein [Maridesulfovibrio ferrireducens]|uniref:hypothetical protein n=1 Tax=Maridesulfovibrio ferrireducens TaxID=246191 RepID=UPI001A263B66|nr:hypothetical protein [Maridesulfovibrio ferrireducens]MBI9109917.1 hypothetical protein [Maridesulfovibrio ferrireducens]